MGAAHADVTQFLREDAEVSGFQPKRRRRQDRINDQPDERGQDWNDVLRAVSNEW